MNRSTRTLSQVLFACVFFASLTSGLRAQGITNTSGPLGQTWPGNPPVGIGTLAPLNALHIHHDPGNSSTMPAILRLSDGSTDTTTLFGTLGLMPNTAGFSYSTYSNLAKPYDLILHQNARFWGDADLIIANFDPDSGGAIRMSTTPMSGTAPVGTPPNDLERVTILQNGNVGIDIPPGAGSPKLCFPQDQVQIGGGVQDYPGPIPGLTIYGGNQFENVMLPNWKIAPVDRRYISYNHYIDHSDTGASRFHRFEPMASSEIDFSSDNGGLLSFNTEPYDASRGLNSFSHTTTLELSGTYGMGMWVYDSAAAVQKHTLFEINPPGIKLGSVTRNTNGLAFFHTPVCITSDTASYMSIDFQNLPLRPNLGDDTTWDLVVNGAALFKEAFVNTNDWPDYVFKPNYKLEPIEAIEKYTETNHHLPDLPSANAMAKTGVPLGQTEAALTKQVEEMMLYIEQQNHRIDTLEAELKELTHGKGK